jgi:NitT/TauT family transport system permease protein
MQNNALPATSHTWPIGGKRTARLRPRRLSQRIAPWITLIVVLLLWQLIVTLEIYPSFIVPPPAAVADKLLDVVSDGRLLTHTWTTLSEVLLGLALGTSFGLLVGYLIAKSPLMESLLLPIIIGLQSTPIVAYAPLLVIWFDNGLTSKVIVCALLVFFPTLMNTVVGIRNVPAPLRDLMLSLRASRWQMFAKLEVPAALPVLLGGLKTSATLAVIGAVVGEFVGSNAGLGFLVNIGRSQYDTPLVIVAVLTLTIMARLLYGAVSALERYTLAWQQRGKS